MGRIQSVNDGEVIENLAVSVGVEDTNVVIATITAVQPRGIPPAIIPPIVGWISTQSDGSDVASTAPDGGIAISGSNGALTEHVADLVFSLQLTNSGTAAIAVTESGANDFYLVLVDPSDGSLVVSAKLDFT
jgi:hypothetical protein